jgi:NitT/TauT family transport system substrate-binding protein
VARKRALAAALLSGGILATLACTASPTSPTASTPAARSAASSPAVAPTSAAGPASSAAPTQAPLAVVRTSRSQGLGNVLQIAVRRGYFEEQRVDLQQIEFRSSAESIPPLSTGQLEAGSFTPNAAFFNALGRGIHLALALDASHIVPGTRSMPLLSRLAGGAPVVRDLPDLRGVRVAHNPRGTIAEPTLERMLAEAGLGVGDLQESTYMPFPDILAALGGGTIDAAVVPEPFATIAEERGLAARVRDGGDYVAGAQIAMMVFSERFARQQPDAARRFAVAYLRGARDYMDAMEHRRDREAVVAILAESAGVAPELLDKAGYFPIRRDGRVNGDALASFADWLAEHGFVEQRPNLAALVDHQFADHAQRTLDHAR